ncbi:porin family protein [Pseudoxanthomonas daejeonensis]|uniref:Outer membrane protein beta-barrel domain-containing protein n=1 Tax=Pseudoxanthomonas daejeonensis TaxID=266062 RepID=A0ABQ6ZB73_9GAMM|nr:hypothetical protein [Pseudoxanthomonas daejeonensis]KAF1697028.1 hypothetical protein CSC65_03075 [Pseudoxanthomonas daejeonensis]UNK56357.1 porin family protein [Pseudoxanthomonas daejeonensis]
MKPRLIATATAALLATTALDCHALEPLDTFSARVGGYVTEFDTKMRADGQADDGTRIDLERDLGIDQNNVLAIIGATWRPWEKHEFGLSYYQDDGDATRQIDRDIEFDGVVYPVSSTLRANLNLDAYEASYVYWAMDRDSWVLGPRLGLIWYSIGLGLSLEVDANGNPVGSGGISNSVSADLPAPSIGGSWRWVPGNSDWRLSADVGYFTANIDNVDADVTTGRFGVEWFPWENWGASLDYTMRRIEADAQGNSFDGNFRFIDSGLRLGVVYRF